MCSGDARDAFPGIDRQAGHIGEVRLHMRLLGNGAKGTDGVEAPFAYALDHARCVRFVIVGSAKFADDVGEIEGEMRVSITRPEGAGIPPLRLRQPFVDALTAFDIGVVIAGCKAADAEVEKGVSIGIDEPRFPLLLLHMKEARLLQDQCFTTAGKAAEAIQPGCFNAVVVGLVCRHVGLEFFQAFELVRESVLDALAE